MNKEILKIIATILGAIVLIVMIWGLLSLGLLYCLNTLFNAGLRYTFINITASMLFILIIKGITSNTNINMKS